MTQKYCEEEIDLMMFLGYLDEGWDKEVLQAKHVFHFLSPGTFLT
jgi:hypothetical protein